MGSFKKGGGMFSKESCHGTFLPSRPESIWSLRGISYIECLFTDEETEVGEGRQDEDLLNTCSVPGISHYKYISRLQQSCELRIMICFKTKKTRLRYEK